MGRQTAEASRAHGCEMDRLRMMRAEQPNVGTVDRQRQHLRWGQPDLQIVSLVRSVSSRLPPDQGAAHSWRTLGRAF